MDQETLNGLKKAIRGKKNQKVRFCEEYIVDWNGTEAVIRAGITENRASAASMASRFLLEPEVRSYLDALIEAEAEAVNVNRESLIVKTERIYKRCMQYKPVLAFNKETKCWEETGEYVFDSKGAAKAAELQAKLTGNLTEKRVHETDDEFEVIFTKKGERNEASS